ncbi:hypothetical protein BLA28_18355 [Eisenbergiella tayi]|nr:hypothetical protein BLA28_18355 [Eisenbergiella tayi]
MPYKEPCQPEGRTARPGKPDRGTAGRQREPGKNNEALFSGGFSVSVDFARTECYLYKRITKFLSKGEGYERV